MADPQQEPLYRACLDDPADTTARLVYADWLEEWGRDAEAEFHRWLLKSGVIDDEGRHPDDPWSWCVSVASEYFPEGIEGLLPRPHIDCYGGPEDYTSDRILESLWVSRETAERDLLLAWLAAWGATMPLFNPSAEEGI